MSIGKEGVRDTYVVELVSARLCLLLWGCHGNRKCELGCAIVDGRDGLDIHIDQGRDPLDVSMGPLKRAAGNHCGQCESWTTHQLIRSWWQGESGGGGGGSIWPRHTYYRCYIPSDTAVGSAAIVSVHIQAHVTR